MDINKLLAEYDRLYDKASEIIQQRNPCDIKREEDGAVTCRRTRLFPDYDRNGCLCCGGCPHLGPDGCTVRALGCRVESCGGGAYSAELAQWPEGCYDELQVVAKEARAIGIPLYYRASKEGIFRRLR